ncbi:ABC transporter substrate-binding protein [Nonomuraea sp. NPDC049709]|uniref:ABC transporter substrate-binding protein n=1 Tax=Nonomuraea sp. NPDC049709 TaxID=3154736 RepID=UPI00342FA60D
MSPDRRLRVGVPLSLSGRHARFGRQAALGLEVWGALGVSVDVLVEDDRSDPDVLEGAVRRLAGRCDLLLGPYSTQLMRRAGRVAAELDRLVWNHGGSGDDVETAYPGHVVSIPAPAGRYAEPFIRHLADGGDRTRLLIVQGRGRFGRQVAEGAERLAGEAGIPVTRAGPGEVPAGGPWNLLCAGSFDEDVEVIRRARAGSRVVCAVAAGVREFGEAIDEPGGIYGVGQWFPGSGGEACLGISEREFLDAYRARAGRLPDYPAVQAVAAAIIATHCALRARGAGREELWAVAAGLETSTLFGAFAIDPRTGAQTAHRAVLTRWVAREAPTGLPARPVLVARWGR